MYHLLKLRLRFSCYLVFYSLSLLYLSHIRMTITMQSRRLGWPPGDQITLSSLSSHIEHSVEFTYSCFITALHQTSSSKTKNTGPNLSPQRQEYCTLGIPINAENNKHVRGCYESPCPCHHQHFADEIPRIPLK